MQSTLISSVLFSLAPRPALWISYSRAPLHTDLIAVLWNYIYFICKYILEIIRIYLGFQLPMSLLPVHVGEPT